MQKRFEGNTVLVTGAGGGIGLAVVRRFAEEGATIVASDVSGEGLLQAVAVCSELGAPITPLPGDLVDAAYCDQLPARACEVSGTLDIVINNAGLMRRGNILETSDDDWAALQAVNVEAVFRICRAAIPIMRDQGGGAIVNTASCWGRYPGPDHLAYCTTKAAVAAMTQCLGRDHAADGIRVNAVCPNEVNTPMLRSGFEIRGLDPDTAIEQLNQSVPLGRIAEPGEIADAIAYLASDQAAYVCGSLLEVNGAKPVY